MPWARFKSDWKWPRLKPWHRRYHKGRAYNLDKDTHKAAVAEGVAVHLKAPANREAADALLASVVMPGEAEPGAAPPPAGAPAGG